MKKNVYLILLIVIVWGCSQIQAVAATDSPKAQREDLSNYFTGYDGCMVLFDRDKNEYTVYNEAKSLKRVPPCSSFKIINSLIGLETKVLTDENTTFQWDGTRYPIGAWNKDQTLQTAVSYSVVWYFQRVASQVGAARMQEFLDKLGYGNRDISGGITRFWLQSSLQISPREQVDILRQFYDYQLPFSRRNVDIVKKVILLSNLNGVRFSGKTGSGMDPNNIKAVNGWFVGYAEKNQNVYFFATNIETDVKSASSADGMKAKEITMQILKDKRIL